MFDAEAVTAGVLSRLPPDERTTLTLRHPATAVPATRVLDPDWMSEQLQLRALRWDIEDRFLLGTLWWYSASNWLVLPTIASSFFTGRPLSPALKDVSLHCTPDGRIPGATSKRVLSGSVAEALAESLGATIEHLAAICGKGERRLWSFAVDAIAGRYLWAGTVTQQVAEAQQAAKDLVAQLPGRLPQPRFQQAAAGSDSAPRIFVQRGSCCLLYEVPGKRKCANCPRQRPETRMKRLRELDG